MHCSTVNKIRMELLELLLEAISNYVYLRFVKLIFAFADSQKTCKIYFYLDLLLIVYFRKFYKS